MFKPHAGVKVFFVDCFVDSRSYEASCSRWNRVLLPMMARRTSCCLPYLRSRKEIFFCVLLVSPLKQCDVLWRFFFDFRLSLSQFWPLFSDCSETWGGGKAEFRTAGVVFAAIRTHRCWGETLRMSGSIHVLKFLWISRSVNFFFIFHSTFKLSWCDLRPGQRAASKTLKRNRKLSTRQPDSICIRKADLNRKSLVPNEIDDWQATSLVSMLRVELNSEQAKWKSWKFKSIFF